MATKSEEIYGIRDLTRSTKEQARKAAEKLGQYQEEAQGLFASAWNRVKSLTQCAWQNRAIRIFTLIFGAISGVPIALFTIYALIASCAITGFAIISWLTVTAGALAIGAAVLSPVLFFTFCISTVTLGGFLIANFVYNVACNILGYLLGNNGDDGEGRKRNLKAYIQRGGEKAREIASASGETARSATSATGAGEGGQEHGGATGSRRESTLAAGK